MGNPRHNFFLPLALAYLVCPSLIFLTTWVRPVIGLPSALIVLAALLWLVRSPALWTPRPAISRGHFWLTLGLALVWTVLGGVGGLVPQSADYIKHTLLFHDLIHQSWPVHYTLPGGEKYFLCYGLGYYLVPALGAKLVGESLLPGLILAWTFAGMALFLYWVATLGSSPRKTLAMVLLFAVTGMLWKLFKDHGLPGLIPRETAGLKSFEMGLFYSYNDSFTRFQYQPQHASVGWLGAAVLYELIWVRKNPQGVFFAWVACVFWSPLSSIGLLLVPLAALKAARPEFSTGSRPARRTSLFFHNLKTIAIRYFEPVNVIGGGILLAVLTIYLHAHVPVALSGPIWRLAPGTNWVLYYSLFIALELSPVLLLVLADWRHAFLGELRPLVYLAALLLILLPFYKLGLSSDLRLEASAPILLFVALGAARCWQSPVFRLRRPVFAALTVVVLLGASYPLLRPWQNLLSNHTDRSYAGIVKENGFRDLTELRDHDPNSGTSFDSGAQYLGTYESAAGRYLLK